MADAPETLGEFRALPTIASQFPLVYKTGGRWESMTGHCAKCERPFTDSELRGHVTQPFGETFIMEAWGLCPDCRLLSPIRYRFPPDMSMVGRSPKTNEWSVWGARREKPWWKRLLGFV